MGYHHPRLWKKRLLFLSISLLFGAWGGLVACQCGEEYQEQVDLKVDIIRPQPSSISGVVEVTINVNPLELVHYTEVTITPQQRVGITNETERKLAQLFGQEKSFSWNTFQSPDGFYQLRATAYDVNGNAYISRTTLVQIQNDPPQMWFVNCRDGQWIRGMYAVVVAIDERRSQLSEPPTLSVNGVQGEKTRDFMPPYRFLIPTQKYLDGEPLTINVEGKDERGNLSRITCTPRIDNTPPTLRFIEPAKEDTLVGRSFRVRFEAKDRFTVREVRLWVDGSGCVPEYAFSPGNIDPYCPEQGEPWISRQAPEYPIRLALPASYNTEQPIVLSARAVDEAGNLSDPPTQLRVYLDPVAPEIFIRSPGEGQVFEEEMELTARITDSQALSEVRFTIRAEQDGKLTEIFKQQRIDRTEITPSVTLKERRKTYGAGRFTFEVTATDSSKNTARRQRLFLIGCGDSTDCPAGQICHKTRCMTPAKLGEACHSELPCEIGTDCVRGQAPVCGASQGTFCRKRCNPGNQFVSADPCDKGYYCQRSSATCLPTEGCTPLGKDCPSGTQCILADDDASYCAPIGPVPLNASCSQDCNAQGNCERDAWCIILINVGRTACAKICDTTAPRCPSGTNCRALIWSFGGKPLRYGVCQ